MGNPLKAIGKGVRTAADIGAIFHLPILTQIDAAVEAIEYAKNSSTKKGQDEGLEEAQEKLNAVREFFPGMLAAMDEQIRSAAPEQQSALESKKFIAFAIMIGITLFRSVLTMKFGIPEEAIEEAMKLAMLYIGVQGTIDAVKQIKKPS